MPMVVLLQPLFLLVKILRLLCLPLLPPMQLAAVITEVYQSMLPEVQRLTPGYGPMVQHYRMSQACLRETIPSPLRMLTDVIQRMMFLSAIVPPELPYHCHPLMQRVMKAMVP